MRILIVYWNMWGTTSLEGVRDHLKAMEDEAPWNQYFYFDMFQKIPEWIAEFKFEAIFFHNTMLCLRQRYRIDELIKKTNPIHRIKAVKVAFPQDEYDESETLELWLEAMGVHIIFSNFPEYADVIYPKLSKSIKIEKALTGYVSKNLIEKSKLYWDFKKKYSIGYRASSLPYYFGSQGLLKYDIGKKFLEYNQIDTGNIDISLDRKDVLYGNKWFKFIASCETVLGTESGSTLLVKNKIIKEKMHEYIKINPAADFEEINNNIFENQDGKYCFLTTSPRHFEAAALKVCQILIKGKYENIFIPNVHYIELEKNFSNIDDVIEKSKNKNLLKDISENTYKDIIQCERYSYKSFTKTVEKCIKYFLAKSVTNTKLTIGNKKLKCYIFLYLIYEKLFTYRIFGEFIKFTKLISPKFEFYIRKTNDFFLKKIKRRFKCH